MPPTALGYIEYTFKFIYTLIRTLPSRAKKTKEFIQNLEKYRITPCFDLDYDDDDCYETLFSIWIPLSIIATLIFLALDISAWARGTTHPNNILVKITIAIAAQTLIPIALFFQKYFTNLIFSRYTVSKLSTEDRSEYHTFYTNFTTEVNENNFLQDAHNNEYDFYNSITSRLNTTTYLAQIIGILKTLRDHYQELANNPPINLKYFEEENRYKLTPFNLFTPKKDDHYIIEMSNSDDIEMGTISQSQPLLTT